MLMVILMLITMIAATTVTAARPPAFPSHIFTSVRKLFRFVISCSWLLLLLTISPKVKTVSYQIKYTDKQPNSLVMNGIDAILGKEVKKQRNEKMPNGIDPIRPIALITNAKIKQKKKMKESNGIQRSTSNHSFGIMI